MLEGAGLPPDANGVCCAAVQVQLLLQGQPQDAATHFVTATGPLSGGQTAGRQLGVRWDSDLSFSCPAPGLLRQGVLRCVCACARARVSERQSQMGMGMGTGTGGEGGRHPQEM